MATKTKVTAESASKPAKKTSVVAKVQPPEKKAVVKSAKSALPTKESTPKKTVKPAKDAVTDKPKTKSPVVPPASKTVAVAKQSAVPPVTKVVEKAKAKAKAAAVIAPVQKTVTKVQSAPDKSSAPVPSGVAQDKKWLEIRLILEKLKEDTLREIRKSVKNGTEALASIEPGGDIYDQASSERDRELGLLLGDREREKIHSIDEALLRIDEDEYGICEECDEDIPLGRLKAMPFTRHCVKCKSDLEKLQAQTKRVEEERAYREIPLGAEDEES